MMGLPRNRAKYWNLDREKGRDSGSRAALGEI
jgi:hypothetical protein